MDVFHIKSDDGAEEAYRINPMRGKAGLRMMTRLLSVLAPIGGAVGALKGGASFAGGSLDDLDGEAFGGALRQVAETLVLKVDAGLVEDLVATVQLRRGVDPERWETLSGAVFDIHFTRNYGALIELTARVIDANYSHLWRRYLGNVDLRALAKAMRAHLAAAAGETSPS